MNMSDPRRDMHPTFRINAEKMTVESSMVEMGQAEPIGNQRMAQSFVAVFDDVGGIDQSRYRQARHGAAVAIRLDHTCPEQGLMKAALRKLDGVAPGVTLPYPRVDRSMDPGLRRGQRRTDLNPQKLGLPRRHERRGDRPVAGGGDRP